MDEKTSESGRVDAVLNTVTFYPQHSHTSSFRKTVPDVHMKAAAHTTSGLASHNVSVRYTSVQKTTDRSERCNSGRKSMVLDKRPKSIESAKLMKSKYRSIHKPKYTLLPYKRGQLKFCTESGNVTVRNRTSAVLNSELSVEKENKMYSDDCNINASTEKLNTRGEISRRFFKASFGKRRQFTLGMRGVTTGHMKFSHLNKRERNTAVRIKQLRLNATNDCSKSENVMESAVECCKNDLSTVSNIDTAFESACEDAVHNNNEAVVESSDGNVDTGSQNGSNAEYVVLLPNHFCCSSDVKECCPVASTSNMVDHSTASPAVSTADSESYSDNTVTSPSLKRGLGLSPYDIRTSKRKSEDTVHKTTKKDGEQLLLDFGQKLHETVNCGVCGMTYVHYEPVDELTHSQYHRKVLATLKFTGWRKTAQVHDFDDGSCVIGVSCDDKRSCRRVAEIKKLVDKELGYIVEGSLSSHSKTYLYISNKHVVGFCLAQHITHGYRLLSPDESDAEENRSRTRSCCCSEQPVPARCGISRIWVLASERRKHVASRLLDVVRGDFLMGYPVAKEELAFSDPTPDGIKFATRYTGTSAFLVYKTAA